VKRVAAGKPPPRATRRKRGRAHAKLVRDLERLARLRPGGAPDRPLDVDSPAQVEVIATTSPCPLCEGTLRLVEHAADTLDGVRLRLARLVCTACGTARTRYFRLATPLPH